jgi:hypothetical protein
MIKKYADWLNESTETEVFASKLIEKLREAKFPTAKFRDSWTVSDEEYDEGKFTKAYKSVVWDDVYVFEFEVDISDAFNNKVMVRIGGFFDTRKWKLDIIEENIDPNNRGNAKLFKQIFDDLLRELKPTEFHGQKYGI